MTGGVCGRASSSSRIPFRMLHFLLLGVTVVHGVSGLRMLELAVPAAVMRGDSVFLNCTYDLEGDQLYSIKWYKNNVEFYRYLPNENPPGQLYTLRGIYIDTSYHLGKSIFLYKTDLNSEGTYRCEVSAEESFQTVRDDKELRVYVFPDRGPTILGAKNRYRIGDDVNVTCMSGPSKPPSFLQWYINGKEVSPYFISRLSPLRHPDGLLSSMLGLKFMVEPIHFWNGAMRLRCTAFIAKAYLTTKSEIVATNRAKTASLRQEPNPNGPVITGGRLRYQVSNVVNVNCTANKAHPPAELRWYINDKEANQDYLRPYAPIRYPDGHDATVLGQRFTVKLKHFQRGEMRLKCTSTLSKVVNMTSEEMVISNRHHSSGLQVSINRGNVLNDSRSIKIEFPFWTSLITGLLLFHR